MLQTLPTRYQLLEVFKGGSSILQKVQDLRSNQTVVLKFPATPKLPEARERIAREAHIFQQLEREGHVPGLVRFVGYEKNEGHPLGPFLALEFLQGATLEEQLKTKGVLSEEKVIALGRSVCKILGKLHARGVVHRDLSLKNIILLAGSGDVRIIDLGLALIQGPDNSYEAYDKGKIGTPTTRAPEISASFPGDERSDIFSLGMVLYQIANGTENSGQELHGLDSEAKSRVSKALSKVIVRCVQKSREARYQTIQELDRALRLLQTKKVAIRASRTFGALLLSGGIVAAVAYVFSPSTPTPTTTQKIPSTTSAPVFVVEASTQPTTRSNEVPAPEKTQTATKPTKPTKPKEEQQTAKGEPTPPKEEELELSQELIDYVTRPIPTAKPRPIELRVETKGKK